MTDVGYMKPPKESRFQKGTSGNPKGRPRYSKNTYTLLTKMLDGKITLMENGKRIQVTRKFAFLMRLLTSALNGDLKAAGILFPHLIQADIKTENIEANAQALITDDKELLDKFIADILQENNNGDK